VELEDRESIINISPDTLQHTNKTNEMEWFWLEERRNRKTGFDILPYYDELNRLLRLIKELKE